MNKKGFTIVELLVTFSLITIIATILIQITLTLKELYITGDMKTTLLTKQGTMTKKIYTDLDNKNLLNITSCGNLCISFTYDDTIKQLKVDQTKKIVTYDNYSIKLGDNTGNSFGNLLFFKTSFQNNNQLLLIKIPIKNKLLKGDYGLSIIYQYDNSQVNVSDLSQTFK